MQHERVRLPAAHPAVRADQLLERRDLVEVVPVGAVDDDVRAVREAVGAADVVGRVRAERRQRVLALDRAVGEPHLAARAEHDAVDEQNATPSWSRSASDQPRPQLLDAFERQPPRLARERDQPEVARGHHRHLGHALDHLLVEPVAGRGAHRVTGRRVARGELGDAGAQRGGALVLCGRPRRARRRPRSGRRCPRGLAVALAERRALALAMVGEHDQLVGARRMRDRGRDVAIARSTRRSTASVSGRSRPEWCATSS